MTLPSFLTSRKFWALIIGAAVVVLRSYVPNFPLSDDQVTELALLVVAYIIGTGLQGSSQPSAAGEQLAALRLQLAAMNRELLNLRSERGKQAFHN